MNVSIADIISSDNPPALLIGNGINRYSGATGTSWDDLLKKISQDYGQVFTDPEIAAMTNTERYDILDIMRPNDDRSSL